MGVCVCVWVCIKPTLRRSCSYVEFATQTVVYIARSRAGFQVRKTLQEFECRPATSWRWGPHESCTTKTSSHHHPNPMNYAKINWCFLKKNHENTRVWNRSTEHVLGIPGIIFLTLEKPALGPTRLGGGDDQPGWLGAAAGGNRSVVPLPMCFGQNMFKAAMELNIMSSYFMFVWIDMCHHIQI